MGTKKTIRVSLQSLRIQAIHFATARHGSTDVHSLYEESDSHPLLPGKNLHAWSIGAKVTDPEWTDARDTDGRACYTRRRAVTLSVKLVSTTKRSLSGTLHATPALDGSSRHLLPVAVPFTYPAGAAEQWVDVTLGGVLPDEVGRYVLALAWGISGRGFRFQGPKLTKHKIYALYGPPLDPDFDSAVPAATGNPTTRAQGTLSGTRKRLDHLMALLGGSDRRHSAASAADIIDLYWKLHVGINDTPGAPPYFDGGHTEHLTIDGTSSGTPIPLRDQWLAWVSSSPHWNDASCIGHVQLAKTMLAAIGLFARRTWVFPHTPRLPDGTTTSFVETDLYCLGTYDSRKEQTVTIRYNGVDYPATAKLMEPGMAWENFEACMLSPNGKFLTGGYATSSNPPYFRRQQGFNSAAELLHWWCNTSRASFGHRFMAWVHANDSTGEYHIWDVDGTHYDFADYVQIRQRGKQLPPLTP